MYVCFIICGVTCSVSGVCMRCSIMRVQAGPGLQRKNLNFIVGGKTLGPALNRLK